MGSPFESSFQHAIKQSVEQLGPPRFSADEVVRLGRSSQRRRQVVVSSGIATALALVLGVTAFAVGQPDRPGDPTTTLTPPVTNTPSATSTPPTTTTPPAAPPGGASVDFLLPGNVIQESAGRRVNVPVPAGQTAPIVYGVSGGWVVRTVPSNDYFFLTDAGKARQFEPALKNVGEVAVSPDGRQLAAQVEYTIYVFDLPSLTLSAQVDVAERAGSAQVARVWLRGGRLIVQFAVMGDVTTRGFDGVGVWDLSTNSSTAYPSARLWDVSEDGSLALFEVTRDPGTDNATTCMSVAPFRDPLTPSSKIVCGPSPHFAHFSPDGTWIAHEVSPTGTSTTVWLYRTADVAQGVVKPVKIDNFFPGGHVNFVAWETSQRLIATEERRLAIKRCQVTGACQSLPGTPAQKPVGLIVNHDA